MVVGGRGSCEGGESHAEPGPHQRVTAGEGAGGGAVLGGQEGAVPAGGGEVVVAAGLARVVGPQTCRQWRLQFSGETGEIFSCAATL